MTKLIILLLLPSLLLTQKEVEIPQGLMHNYKIKPNNVENIHVTNWLLNIPSDKTFKNKFVVLNYWCDSPVCVNALNKIETLISLFSHKKKLIFVTYSNDDSLSTVNQLKKYKVDTKSTVVINTRKVDNLWSNGIDRIVFPFLLLIDDRGKTIWVTSSSSINEEVLDSFLKRKLEPATSFR